MKKVFAIAICAVAMKLPYAYAEDTTTSCQGAPLTGTVRDATQALIPGATVTLDDGVSAVSGTDGVFRFACVGTGAHRLTATEDGFATVSVALKVPHAGPMDLVMQPAEVQTEVEVSGDSGAETSTTSSGPTQTIAGKQLQSLADDPDDLQRELQQLAAASGGSPANTTISVDGFQDSTTLPPKSSIAYIKVNPDLYSAEYRQPPFEGGRVEVYTKPGQTTFHGALFATNGSPWENARDPFSTSKAALGKQRYGFELTGPIQKKGSDFALNLEHRSIDNFAAVDAVTLDGSGNAVQTNANVPTPQRLWIGMARVDWQLGEKNTLIATYNANVNHLQNVGVGGTTLAEGGYDSERSENILRLNDVTTVSAHLMHEARLSLHPVYRTYTPSSTAAQVQVAGAFTGGGNTLGAQQAHTFLTEFDDDAIWTTAKHTLKAGVQFLSFNDHLRYPTNFNGTYTFGGGTAPVLDANNQPTGQTETITGVEQYRRALLSLPGGTPTAYSAVTGSPTIDFTEVTNALFLQDDWNVGHGVHIAAGLRYYVQTHPTTLSGVTPRLGVLWSPSKKETWTLHAHVGMFASRFSDTEQAEVQREDGTARVTSTVYNPVYGSPFSGSPTMIQSRREYSPHITTGSYAIENVGATRTLPGGWNLSADWYIGRLWNMPWTVNVNSPLNGSPTGPRALGIANTDILQLQNGAQGRATVTFFGIENHNYKRVQLFFGGVRVRQVNNNDDEDFSSPQSSFNYAGEIAPPTGQPGWIVFGNATLTLPKKVQLSANYNGGGDAHYNVTTGFDNNGDGNFNDRPQYALPGQAGAVQTPYGLLVASGGTGVLSRNVGVMPWTFYLDMNLQRTFSLTRNAKADHPQALTVNVRSSNVLNHLNVTGVGGVLGSPLFGLPYAADNGRRVELGARYSF